MDILFNFNTGYYESVKKLFYNNYIILLNKIYKYIFILQGKLVTERSKVAVKYLKSTFIIDILVFIPFIVSLYS